MQMALVISCCNSWKDHKIEE